MAKPKTQDVSDSLSAAQIAESAACASPGAAPAEEIAGLEETINNVRTLDATRREILDQQLIEGGTFEDAQEAVNDGYNVPVTLRAIESYFQGSPVLQKRRVERQLERAALLRSACKDPDSADSELAGAIVMTGLQCLNRKPSMPVKDLVKLSLEKDVLKLKRAIANTRLRRELEALKHDGVKRKAERTKWKIAETQLARLQRDMEREARQTGSLSKEAVHKIQEIYGLLKLPVVVSSDE